MAPTSLPRRLRAIDLRIARAQRDIIASRTAGTDPAASWTRLLALDRQRAMVTSAMVADAAVARLAALQVRRAA